MTHLGGPGDDRAKESADDPDTTAARIADAVESLTTLWTVAAQEAALRLSPHQLRALRALEARSDLNLTALAERLDIGLPTASRLCDRLEAAGLLERVPRPHNRRELRLGLTSHGRHVLSDVAGRRAQALAAALGAMAPGERAELSRGLTAFLTTRDVARPRTEDPDCR
ncbi:MarR family winged helix-turn-helix transcriptional regulator [Streptomyces sp. ALI-76-A]|uniref:MarR family winged helix-turn-helix transcriptional regulator n=1 Tax=Streptomyces sp. ALI-76-A TaxID=3025736 RepID=UPI00256EF0C6|nr:MarR family winged helix-turn-helix transcriptional regulator [Streptomyces sp. ALI-76-A]MDL5204324.1 MarR family winged helix-turn-helix transcriptional regulator [Streptomyces sp. ALI-76-A]